MNNECAKASWRELSAGAQVKAEWPKTNHQAITDYTHREITNGVEL